MTVAVAVSTPLSTDVVFVSPVGAGPATVTVVVTSVIAVTTTIPTLPLGAVVVL